MSIDREITAALDALGGAKGEPIIDFQIDPAGALAALGELAEGDGIIVRASPELGEGREGFGPAPSDPVLLRVMRGAREIGQVSQRGDGGRVVRAERVEVDEDERPCCDASSCDRMRTWKTVWLVLDGDEKHVIAEARSLAESPAREPSIEAIASALASALGVEARRAEASEQGDHAARDEASKALSPDAIARFAIRSEGDRVVVRDLGSIGPRADAPRNTVVGLALWIIAGGMFYGLILTLKGGGGTFPMAAFGVAAALFFLAGVAFLGVARFASKYTARSSPLAVVSADRLVIAPWVARDGAVDARPEGRLGAAIPLGEVRASKVTPRDGGAAVIVDTDHGAIDVLVADRSDVARALSSAFDRVVSELRHPRTTATAKQRAKAKR